MDKISFLLSRAAVAIATLSGATQATPILTEPFGSFDAARFWASGGSDFVAVSKTTIGTALITTALSASNREDNPALTNDREGTYYADAGSNVKDSRLGAKWNFNIYIEVKTLDDTPESRRLNSTFATRRLSVCPPYPAFPKITDYQFDVLYDFNAALDNEPSGRLDVTAAVNADPESTDAFLVEGSYNLFFNELTAPGDELSSLIFPPSGQTFNPDAEGEYNFAITVDGEKTVAIDVKVGALVSAFKADETLAIGSSVIDNAFTEFNVNPSGTYRVTAVNDGVDGIIDGVGTVPYETPGGNEFSIDPNTGEFTFKRLTNAIEEIKITFDRLTRRFLEDSHPDRQLQVVGQNNGFLQFFPANTGGANGDPHFLRWGQLHHDSFHGECDLVLTSSKKNKVHVHLRTKIRKNYSYIKTLALSVGGNILEVNQDNLVGNGQNITSHDTESGKAFALSIDSSFIDNHATSRRLGRSTYSVENSSHRAIEVKKIGDKAYNINWGSSASLNVSITGIFLNVNVQGGSDFADSIGLMGEYGSGDMLDRKGNLMDPKDMNAFGSEWQVKQDEGDPMIFSYPEGPQWPESRCVMPNWTNPKKKKKKKNGLRSPNKNEHVMEEMVGREELRRVAEMKCADVTDFDMCVQDILMTGELGLANGFH